MREIGWMLLATLVLMGAGFSCSAIECSSLEKNIGLPTKFSIINGCMVNDGGRWYPTKNWRGGTEN